MEMIVQELEEAEEFLLNKARTLATFSREMNCTKILVSI